ncbi:class I SAM-dependent methyltransferase [Methylobacterium sp. M6A4_1b]|uniref:class I SAM-dependent methyltransferase n=1 Tax=Methylobacterium TaxID=407 RepID=UPI00138F5BC9|nr:class I SAM-dependent methyltransferase [Methylobacterium sp. Leaf104]MCI9882891.1 class I SAM-dependent methyltransferase [Methylobacterium goesingense]
MEVHLWPSPPAQDWLATSTTLRALALRWDRYEASDLDEHVNEHDDMFDRADGDLATYRHVGRSALQIITEAMVASGRTDFEDVLDLPCGGGRVTRHLRPFFPESNLFVADIDKVKESAVAEQFKATPFAFPTDYMSHPSQSFDLIFSGSLLTHFDIEMFRRALDYFVAALKPKGIAVLTLHGRGMASHSLEPTALARLLENKDAFLKHFKTLKRRPSLNIDPETAIKRDFVEAGFGYFAMPSWTETYKQSYGGSYSSPAWIMGEIQSRADCAILGYKEMSYGQSQDALLLQRI